jgi:hypothetical protein
MKLPLLRRRPGRIQPFVLFAHWRSGSTTLVRALERHPKLRVLNEPLSETFTTWRPGDREYRELITDEASLDAELEHMFSEHNGIKVLGYQMPWDLNVHLLRNKNLRVVFLKRLNLMRTVVSGLMAQQTDLWHAWDVEDDREERYRSLQPIPIEEVRKGIADIGEDVGYHEGILRRRRGGWLVITYEELYDGDASERLAALERVYAFLGVDPADARETDHLLDPAQTRLNSEESYAYLPNAREIDEALGSDQTGWLFSRADHAAAKRRGEKSSGPSIDGSGSKVQ